MSIVKSVGIKELFKIINKDNAMMANRMMNNLQEKKYSQVSVFICPQDKKIVRVSYMLIF